MSGEHPLQINNNNGSTIATPFGLARTGPEISVGYNIKGILNRNGRVRYSQDITAEHHLARVEIRLTYSQNIVFCVIHASTGTNEQQEGVGEKFALEILLHEGNGQYSLQLVVARSDVLV